MKKNLLSSPAAMQRIAFLAFAGIALVGCTSNDFVGEQDVIESKSDGAINFNLSVPASTRATQEDATAAATLGNKFIVWGEKNEADASTTAATAANTVFQNYTVSYGASTANTTQSNTDDWEYVGVTSYGSKLTPTAPATQTIKYWDNAATNYVFTAVSALDADITGDKVVITKNTASTTSDEYGKGYTITVKDGATPGSIYIADRIDDTPANLNSSAVKFTFRNFMSKIRFGVFETIPGYKVQITKMYYNSTNSTSQFGVDGKFLKAGASTTYTVTYGNGTTGPLNKPIMTAGGSSSEDTYLATTTGTYFNTDLGTASNAPTYDNGGTYTTIFPYPGNTAMKSLTKT